LLLTPIDQLQTRSKGGRQGIYGRRTGGRLGLIVLVIGLIGTVVFILIFVGSILVRILLAVGIVVVQRYCAAWAKCAMSPANPAPQMCRSVTCTLTHKHQSPRPRTMRSGSVEQSCDSVVTKKVAIQVAID
jgi:hypothetical protein